ADANLDVGLTGILSDISIERPRWNCLKLAELDPRDASYQALVRTLRHAGAMVECTGGAGTWYESTDGLSFTDYLASRPTQLLNTWRRKKKKIKTAGALSSAFLSDMSWMERAIEDYELIY